MDKEKVIHLLECVINATRDINCSGRAKARMAVIQILVPELEEALEWLKTDTHSV